MAFVEVLSHKISDRKDAHAKRGDMLESFLPFSTVVPIFELNVLLKVVARFFAYHEWQGAR
jgi:hypothetical protein